VFESTYNDYKTLFYSLNLQVYKNFVLKQRKAHPGFGQVALYQNDLFEIIESKQAMRETEWIFLFPPSQRITSFIICSITVFHATIDLL